MTTSMPPLLLPKSEGRNFTAANFIATAQSRRRTFMLVVAAAILTWLVISRSLAVYFADAAPNAALWLDSQQPEALINLADHALNRPVKVAGTAAADVDRGPKGQQLGTIEALNRSAAAVQQPQESYKGLVDDKPGAAEKANVNLVDLNREFETIGLDRSVDLSRIRAEAAAAVMRDPLNPRALRLLGQVADASRDEPDALKLMTAAAQISLHETAALYWLLLKSTEARDFKAAIYYADALLRTNPQLAPSVGPVLARFAEQKKAKDLIKTALERNPPWRQMFFAYLVGSVSDPRTPLDLLLTLRKSPTPPDLTVVSDYVNTLITHKLYELAYYTWLQFLPAEQLRTAGFLFNGNFDSKPSGMPFDWKISQGSGVDVDIVHTSDRFDGHALLVDFLYGRVDYRAVRELVLLAPGAYQLDGQYKGKLVGPRGMKWRVACADGGSQIAESPMISGPTSTWKDFRFVFTVPRTGCRAQYVRLDLDARMASEQLVTGSMLFDELHISRVAKQPTANRTGD
jgi:tetratricopeptide (TPR) repeat protein